MQSEKQVCSSFKKRIVSGKKLVVHQGYEFSLFRLRNSTLSISKRSVQVQISALTAYTEASQPLFAKSERAGAISSAIHTGKSSVFFF